MTDETLAWLQRESAGTFFDFIGGRIVSVQDHEVIGEVKIEPHHLNHMAITHGGVYAAMLDHVMGFAAYHSRPQARVVTTNLTIHYVAPIRGGLMKVSGRVVHETSRMLTTEGRICDEAGGLAALATATYRAKG
jgi:uncharacterized protein (TIGR00369 family)